MANLKTQQSTEKLLALPVGTVALIGYNDSQSNSENVNLYFGEVFINEDSKEYSAFMGGTAKQVRRAWRTANKDVAKDLFGITDSSDLFKEAFMKNPKVGEEYVKVKHVETYEEQYNGPIINPSTGDVKTNDFGEEIYRIEEVKLVADNIQIKPVILDKSKRSSGKAAVSSETPFTMEP